MVGRDALCKFGARTMDIELLDSIEGALKELSSDPAADELSQYLRQMIRKADHEKRDFKQKYTELSEHLFRLYQTPEPNYASLKRNFYHEIESLEATGQIKKNKKGETAVRLLKPILIDRMTALLQSNAQFVSQEQQRLLIAYWWRKDGRHVVGSAANLIDSLFLGGRGFIEPEFFRIIVYELGTAAQHQSLFEFTRDDETGDWYRAHGLGQLDFEAWKSDTVSRFSLNDSVIDIKKLNGELYQQRLILQRTQSRERSVFSVKFRDGPLFETTTPVLIGADFMFITAKGALHQDILRTTIPQLMMNRRMDAVFLTNGDLPANSDQLSVDDVRWGAATKQNTTMYIYKNNYGFAHRNDTSIPYVPVAGLYLSQKKQFAFDFYTVIAHDGSNVLAIYLLHVPQEGPTLVKLATDASAVFAERIAFTEAYAAYMGYDPWTDDARSLLKRTNPATGTQPQDVSLEAVVAQWPAEIERNLRKISEARDKLRKFREHESELRDFPERWDLKKLKKEYGADFFVGKVRAKKETRAHPGFNMKTRKLVNTITRENAIAYLLEKYIPDEIRKLIDSIHANESLNKSMSGPLLSNLPLHSAVAVFSTLIKAVKQQLPEIIDPQIEEDTGYRYVLNMDSEQASDFRRRIDTTLYLLENEWPDYHPSLLLRETMGHLFQDNRLRGWFW